jgi:hypothetical protein
MAPGLLAAGQQPGPLVVLCLIQVCLVVILGS